MKKKTNKIMQMIVILIIGGCSIIGIVLLINFNYGKQKMEYPSFVEPTIVNFDSLDTAIVVKIDRELNKITFRNLETGKDYTLTFDGTTVFQDKYGEAMASTQMYGGEIVDVAFVKDVKFLTSLKISDSAWTYQEVTNFKLDGLTNSLYIGANIFELADDYVVSSNGDVQTLMDINQRDVLTIRGIDKKVYSITVEKGHGYVTLANEDDFIGGYIEFGQALIMPIKKDMIYVLPEGVYQVLVSKDGNQGSLELLVGRNQEVNLDLGNIVTKELQYGQVTFSITPADAALNMDGKVMGYSTEVQLTLGTHQMIVSKVGYETLIQYIKVGPTATVITVGLVKTDDAENTENTSDTATSDTSETDTTETDTSETDTTDSTSTDSTDSENGTDTTDNTTNTASELDYLVYVNTPLGVEVYVDGNYKGIAPVSFQKVRGSHVITLRKTGYQTRSYTLEVDSIQKDATYTFPELVMVGE